EAELDQLGAYLDRYPNLYADVAARSQDLALRDREHVRRFVIAHQDKLVYASDRTSQGVASYEEDFRYWETAGTARTFYLERSAQGLALPPHVLEKLYYKNALRAFCGALR
ncbi:MAG TPA: amidohydrolase family protein, partial [Anaeromyxobacter sp.]|nr:amidohydrolase family protein [Anaeromyxobacter sp.]